MEEIILWKGGDLMNIQAKTALVAVTLILTSSVLVSSAFAQTDNPKPGWGFGDKNHIHIGPPGHSVRPGPDPDEIRKFNQHLRQEIEQFIAQLRLTLFHNFFHHS